MQFRRSGQRDDRRRRVLLDDRADDAPGARELARSSASNDPTGSRAARPAAYAGQAWLAEQPRLTDLIPTRRLTLWAAALLVVALAALPIATYGQHRVWSPVTGRASVKALDLSAEAALATWIASFVLLAASVISWLVYTVRRHKVDDYRGRYRLWLQLTALLLFASMDATAGLHRVVAGLLIYVSGTRLLGDGTIWWLLLVGTLWTVYAIRLFFEVRGCRTAIALLAVSSVGYLVATLQAIDVLWLGSGALDAIARYSVVMLGHTGLLLAILVYARFVVMEAEGRIKPRRIGRKKRRHRQNSGDEADNSDEQRRRRQKSDTVEADSGKTRRRSRSVDASETRNERSPAKSTSAMSSSAVPETKKNSAKPATTPDAAKRSSAAESDANDETGDATAEARLSKAERRKLRKQLRRSRRTAEAA